MANWRLDWYLERSTLVINRKVEQSYRCLTYGFLRSLEDVKLNMWFRERRMTSRGRWQMIKATQMFSVAGIVKIIYSFLKRGQDGSLLSALVEGGIAASRSSVEESLGLTEEVNDDPTL